MPSDISQLDTQNRKRFSLVLNNDTPFIWLACLIWIRSILLDYIKVVLRALPIIGAYSDYLIILIYGILIVFSLPHILKHTKLYDWIFAFSVLLVYILNYLLFPQNTEVLSNSASSFFGIVLPLYFIGISLDFEKVKKYFYILSIISIFALLAYRLIFGGGMTLNENEWEEDMVTAYALLPHVLCVLIFTFNKVNILNVISSVVGGVFLISFGTRGPVLILIFFILFSVIFLRKWKHPVIVVGSLVGIITLISVFFEKIIKKLMKISIKYKMSTRIYKKILSGDILNSSGRDTISSKVIDAIKRRPLTGYGIGGDRKFIGSFAGNYSHNLVIELWASFGVIIGTGIVVLIAFEIIRGYIKSKTYFGKAFIVAMAFSTIFGLLLSGTYLNNTFFLFTIGYCIHEARVGGNREK